MADARTVACLRKIADKLEAGESEDEWGPILWLLGRAMSKQVPHRKPPK